MLVVTLGYEVKAQLMMPSMNDVRNGFTKPLKVPTTRNLAQFDRSYSKHLKMLDRRNEKAYRKSFLKFVETEDQLLYTLCEEDEFKANMLMRSAHASFGKIESDRQRVSPKNQQDYNFSLEVLHQVAEISASKIGENNVENSKQDFEKSQMRFSTNLYSSYMKNRLNIYVVSFANGTKKQQKLLRELKRREFLWRAYKSEDQQLTSKFSDKNMGLMKCVQASPEFSNAPRGGERVKDIQKLIANTNTNSPTGDKEGLLGEVKQKLGGLIPDNTAGGNNDLGNISNLIGKIGSLKELSTDSLTSGKIDKEKEKQPRTDPVHAKRLKDRLYGGLDVGVERGMNNYPTGMRITGTGGLSLSKNSGLNLEVSSVLNTERLRFNKEEFVHAQVVSNYTVGTNLDYRVWKVFFAGAGADLIVNQIEAPLGDFMWAHRFSTYTLGVPIILKAILPVNSKSSTTVEFRYDLNNKNNIKPQFDFRVGFLIGRR